MMRPSGFISLVWAWRACEFIIKHTQDHQERVDAQRRQQEIEMDIEASPFTINHQGMVVYKGKYKQ